MDELYIRFARFEEISRAGMSFVVFVQLYGIEFRGIRGPVKSSGLVRHTDNGKQATLSLSCKPDFRLGVKIIGTKTMSRICVAPPEPPSAEVEYVIFGMFKKLYHHQEANQMIMFFSLAYRPLRTLS